MARWSQRRLAADRQRERARRAERAGLPFEASGLGGTCPHCGSDDLETRHVETSAEFDGASMASLVCSQCGSEVAAFRNSTAAA